MTFSYFPGCTLKTKAKDLDLSARKAAEALGVTLREIDDWQCCGGAYLTAKKEIAPKLSSIRALAKARDKKEDLLTLCSACHNVIKQVNDEMIRDPGMAERANLYLGLDKPYTGETKVVHYLEMLRDTVGFDNIAKAVKKPFSGKKIAAYYGCLLLRPGKVMQMDDPEHPTIIEDFIKAIGAEPVIYPMRNECCGGYLTMEDKEIPKKMASKVLESAKEMGAETVVTACPLCLYNLKKSGCEGIEVRYFTELLSEALGI